MACAYHVCASMENTGFKSFIKLDYIGQLAVHMNWSEWSQTESTWWLQETKIP